MGTTGKGESKTSKRRLAAVQKQALALEFKMSGMTYDQIKDKLGYRSVSGAYKAVQTALQKTLQEPADEFRRLEGERLDAAQLTIWPDVLSGNIEAIETFLKISGARCKLFGLNAPARIETSGEMHLTPGEQQTLAEWRADRARRKAEAEAAMGLAMIAGHADDIDAE